MIYFLRGKVAIIEQESIVIDVRDVGYQMLFSHIEQFHVGDVFHVLRCTPFPHVLLPVVGCLGDRKEGVKG